MDSTNKSFLAKVWYELFTWARDLYSCPKAIKDTANDPNSSWGDIFLYYIESGHLSQ